jgi:methylmalonyl-CoA/ethylmalonyl-CoA epimerase
MRKEIGRGLITRIDHVGVAVKDLEEVSKLFHYVLGLETKDIQVIEGERVKAGFITLGETTIEFLESTDPEGPIARFIERRGQGIHHIAFTVKDVDEVVRRAKEAGLKLVYNHSRPGYKGTRIAFLHPKQLDGIMVEFVEHIGEKIEPL